MKDIRSLVIECLFLSEFCSETLAMPAFTLDNNAMAEKANKKKLTEEELHNENENIRSNMRARDMMTKEDSQRIVDSLRMKNLFAYILAILLPIIGVPIIWIKQKDLKLRNSAVLIWTFVGVVILVQQVLVVLRLTHVIS